MTTETTSTSAGSEKVPFLWFSILYDQIYFLDENFYYQFPMQIYKTGFDADKYTLPEIYISDWWTHKLASSHIQVSDINAMHAEGLRILSIITERRKKWSMLVSEGKQLRPICHKITQGFREWADSYSYQYGSNSFIDSICIGFLWSIVWGLLTFLIWVLLLLIFFPFGFIYDSISGRRTAQAAWFRSKIKEQDYNACGSISAENFILTEFDSYSTILTEKLGADKFKVELCKDFKNKEVLQRDIDNDHYVTHQFRRYCMILYWIGRPLTEKEDTTTTTTDDSNSKV